MIVPCCSNDDILTVKRTFNEIYLSITLSLGDKTLIRSRCFLCSTENVFTKWKCDFRSFRYWLRFFWHQISLDVGSVAISVIRCVSIVEIMKSFGLSIKLTLELLQKLKLKLEILSACWTENANQLCTVYVLKCQTSRQDDVSVTLRCRLCLSS